MDYHSVLKRKEILTCATTWKNLKDIVWRGISQHKRTNTVWLYSHKGPGDINYIQTESMKVGR